jgi:hypothetical protein
MYFEKLKWDMGCGPRDARPAGTMRSHEKYVGMVIQTQSSLVKPMKVAQRPNFRRARSGRESNQIKVIQSRTNQNFVRDGARGRSSWRLGRSRTSASQSTWHRDAHPVDRQKLPGVWPGPAWSDHREFQKLRARACRRAGSETGAPCLCGARGGACPCRSGRKQANIGQYHGIWPEWEYVHNQKSFRLRLTSGLSCDEMVKHIF